MTRRAGQPLARGADRTRLSKRPRTLWPLLLRLVEQQGALRGGGVERIDLRSAGVMQQSGGCGETTGDRPVRKPASARAWCPRSWRSSSAGVSGPALSELARRAARDALGRQSNGGMRASRITKALVPTNTRARVQTCALGCSDGHGLLLREQAAVWQECWSSANAEAVGCISAQCTAWPCFPSRCTSRCLAIAVAGRSRDSSAASVRPTGVGLLGTPGAAAV